MKATSQDRPTLERRQSAPSLRATRRPDQELRDLLLDVIRDPAAAKGQHTPVTASWRWHDLSRDEPRTDVPSGDEEAMLTAAIREDCTTREQIVTYFLKRLARLLVLFPDSAAVTTEEVIYVQFTKELAEAVHGQTLAHACPTPENRRIAVRETRELVPIAELACAALEQRLPRHVLPMGAWQ